MNYSRNKFNSEFYIDLAKWRKSYSADTHMVAIPTPDGFYHITQTGSAAEIDYITNQLNEIELKAGRRNNYVMLNISRIPDESEPLEE